MEKNVSRGVRTKFVAKNKVCARHYFAGANTAGGFFGLFDQINVGEGGMLYILKGGPGTGKSTLMKTVGKAFLDKGFSVEFFYCSSDYKSLDGVRLPDYNIAIVDGTAPHVCEASMPAVRERIINLGEHIGEGVAAFEKDIAALLERKKLHFDAAYLYLKNASNLFEANNLFFSQQNDRVSVRAVTKRIVGALELEKAYRPAKVRRLFLEAVSDGGTVNFAAQNKYSRVIHLTYNSFINGKILASLYQTAEASGWDMTCFMEILAPQTISAIYIQKANTLIVQSADESKKKPNKFVSYNNEAIRASLKQAAESIQEAKKAHKKIESYYIPNMNFEKITKTTEDLILTIKESIKKQGNKSD